MTYRSDTECAKARQGKKCNYCPQPGNENKQNICTLN